MKKVLCLAIIFISTSIVQGKSLCGDDWIAYKDDKCVKLFQTFAARHQAEATCNEQDSTLVTINSAAEQKFLIEYVFKASDSNNVWIGAERRLDSSTEFDWNDGTPVKGFTNWAIGRPSDDIRRSCVHMQSPLSRNVSQMEWVDVSCNNGHWFICEKLQTWSIQRLQQVLLSTRRELQYSVESFTIVIDEIRKLMTDMRSDFTTQLNNLTDLMTDTRNTVDSQATQLISLTDLVTDTRNTVASQATEISSNTNLLTDTRNTLAAQASQVDSNTNLLTETRNSVASQALQISSNTNLLTDTRNTVASQAIQLTSTSNLLTDTRNTLTTQGTQLQALQANPVPSGFIYVQLSSQPEPRTIWPTVSWTEVTSQYAGVFFRAAGGTSAAFGTTQIESSPRLTFVNRVVSGQFWTGANVFADGSDSNAVGVGAPTTSTWGLTFRVSAAEVRPRNQAVRIWRRI